jgi:hypothetical protein
VSVIIAAAGVYFYAGKLDRELMVEVTNFKAATSNYEKDTDRLDAIVAMDRRLALASTVLDKGVSLNTLFTALERSVIGTAQLSSLSIMYNDDAQLELVAGVDTDSFDSTIFQRSILASSDVFKDVKIEDVTIENQNTDSLTAAAVETEESITFTATITVDPAVVPAVVVRDSIFVPVSDSSEDVAPIMPEEIVGDEVNQSESDRGDTETGVVNVGFEN